MWNQGLVCFWQIREKGDESQTSLWFHAKFSTQSVHTLVRKMFLLFLSSSAATIVSHRKPVLRSGLASNFPNSDSSLKRVSDRHSVSVRQCVCMCVCSASDSHTHTHTHSVSFCRLIDVVRDRDPLVSCCEPQILCEEQLSTCKCFKVHVISELKQGYQIYCTSDSLNQEKNPLPSLKSEATGLYDV